MTLRRIIAAAVFAAAALPLAALETIGEITYLDGKVEIVRDGAPLPSSQVKEGLDLANFDLLKTGSDGRAELRISSGAAAATTITVSARTQFSIEIGKAGSKQQTTVDLVVGSVALKCAKLGSSQSMRVLTESTMLGVRGTSFSVDVPASGDMLVACDEGEVACTDEKGVEMKIVAGEAIERRWGQPLARLVLKGEYAAARRSWTADRIAALKAGLPALVKLDRARFNVQLASFNRQYRALRQHQRLFDGWDSEDRSGLPRRPLAQLSENVKLALRLAGLRRTLFALERTYARLCILKQYCGDQGCPGRVGLLQTYDAFFRSLDRKAVAIEFERARVRRLARQFADRNDGRVPGGAFDPIDWKSFFVR